MVRSGGRALMFLFADGWVRGSLGDFARGFGGLFGSAEHGRWTRQSADVFLGGGEGWIGVGESALAVSFH